MHLMKKIFEKYKMQTSSASVCNCVFSSAKCRLRVPQSAIVCFRVPNADFECQMQTSSASVCNCVFSKPGDLVKFVRYSQ